MVMHDGLPVYREAYNLILQTHILTKQFSKDAKYTLGTTLRESSFHIVRKITQANATLEKSKRWQFLRNALQFLEDYRLTLRICHDLQEVSLKKFATVSEIVESTSKQLIAWHKSVLERGER